MSVAVNSLEFDIVVKLISIMNSVIPEMWLLNFVVVFLMLAPGALYKRCPSGYPCFWKHYTSVWFAIPQ